VDDTADSIPSINQSELTICIIIFIFERVKAIFLISISTQNIYETKVRKGVESAFMRESVAEIFAKDCFALEKTRMPLRWIRSLQNIRENVSGERCRINDQLLKVGRPRSRTERLILLGNFGATEH
jgi:hypothetical protein